MDQFVVVPETWRESAVYSDTVPCTPEHLELVKTAMRWDAKYATQRSWIVREQWVYADGKLTLVAECR